MLSIWASWGDELTSLNGTVTSVTCCLKSLCESIPFLSLPLSCLELICFSEGRTLNSLSKKPLQTGICEHSRFSSTIPTHECLPVNYYFSPEKPQMCQRCWSVNISNRPHSEHILYAVYFPIFPEVHNILEQRQYQSFCKKKDKKLGLSVEQTMLLGTWHLFYTIFIWCENKM